MKDLGFFEIIDFLNMHETRSRLEIVNLCSRRKAWIMKTAYKILFNNDGWCILNTSRKYQDCNKPVAIDQVNGYVDETAAWNKALRPSDVQNIYNSGCPKELIEDDSLIFWLRMGDKTQQRGSILIPDETDNNNYGTMGNMDLRNIYPVTPR